MGKHINKSNSVIICRIYKQYKGKWDKIMADPEIKTLGYQRHQLEHHLSYKKRQLPKKKDKLKHDRGNKAREKVFKMLENLENSEENQDDISSNTYDISSSSNEEEFELTSITGRKIGNKKTPTKWYAIYSDGDERWVPQSCFVDPDETVNALFLKFQEEHPGNDNIKHIPTPVINNNNNNNNKRPISSENIETVIKKPKLKRELSDASKHLEELNKELISTSVSSSDIQSSEDMIKVKIEAQDLTKKEVRSSRIAEKERESKAIASSFKKHQENTESQASMQSTMQMMGLQMLQKMMKENETEEVEKEVKELKKEFETVKGELKVFGNTLNGIENTQTKLLSLISQLANKNVL